MTGKQMPQGDLSVRYKITAKRRCISVRKQVPIKEIDGVELVPTDIDGIARVVVSETAAIDNLSWDRFVRLKAVADVIEKCVGEEASILDAGGFDGALALFLPNYNIDLLDPATTGASLLEEPAASQSYDLVASVDVLEHIQPADRRKALAELTRVARRFIVFNYPHKATKAAQQLVYRATNNSLIREHVEWDLPEADEILQFMQSSGFSGEAHAHSSLAVWLGQYLTLNLAPEKARELNQYLIANHAQEPFTTPLYELVLCKRNS